MTTKSELRHALHVGMVLPAGTWLVVLAWFSYDDAKRGASGCTDSDVTKFILGTESRLSSLSIKIQRDMSVLNEMGQSSKCLQAGPQMCRDRHTH